MIRELQKGPQLTFALHKLFRILPRAVYLHVATLKESGWVRQNGQWITLVPPRHPVGNALLQIL